MSDPSIRRIEMSDIFVDESFNCRGRIEPMDVVDLAKDIILNGLIQPVSVVPMPTEHDSDKPYMLIAGFRRYMAHRVNSATSILCVVIERVMSEVDRRLFNLSENIQREQLNIVQEARALSRLKMLGLTEVDTATQLHKSRGWVQVRYMILELPEELYPDLIQGTLTQSQVRNLYSIYRATKWRKESVFDAAKRMKDDKIKGIKDRDYTPKTSKTKKTRGKRELFDMIDLLYEEFKNSQHHKFMAISLGWAAGSVTDGDFYKKLKDVADEAGIFWDIPEEFIEED